MIFLESNPCPVPNGLTENSLKNSLTSLVSTEGFELGVITIIFCSDESLLNINQEHLNHDYYTDIITFDYCEGKEVSGDLFVSVDRIIDNADQEKVSFDSEINRVIIHGVLHLCGYKDKTQEEIKTMRSKENYYLSQIGFT